MHVQLLTLERRAKNRAKYAKNHNPKYSKNGKKQGRPRKRKNEKFEPVNDNDDTNWMNVDLKAQGMFG